MNYAAYEFLFENIRIDYECDKEGATLIITTYNPQNFNQFSTHTLKKMSVRRARSLLRRYKINPRKMGVLFDQRWYKNTSRSY